MLTAYQIDVLRSKSEQLLDPLTSFLIEDIAKRIAEAGQLTGTAAYQAWKLQQMGVSQKQLKKEIAKRLKVSQQTAENLLTQAAEAGYNFDISRFPTKHGIPLSANSSLQQILDTTVKLAKEDLSNITQTIGFVGPDGVCRELTDAYNQACDFAFQKVSTGAQDYMSAIREATRNLAEKGIRTIDYESGVHTSMEAAVRRNIMGGMGLMQEQISQEIHDEVGCDGWEISAHGGCAPDHEPIQGRQFSDKEFKNLNSSLVRRIGTLNCGHSAMPIILGVNEPQYTKAELEQFREQNEEGVTYEGKHYTLYEATQRQRKLERTIRKQKRRILVDEATGDNEKLQNDQIRLQVLKQEYTRFSKGAGLPMQHARMETAGFDWKKAKVAEKQYRDQYANNALVDRSSEKIGDKGNIKLYHKEEKEITIKQINERGTNNLIRAYDRRRVHFGLNMTAGEDILRTPLNTFVEDYNGVSAETADTFEKTIAKLSEKYYTGLTRVEVGNQKELLNSGKFAFVQPSPTTGSNTLVLNPHKMSDYSRLTVKIKEMSQKGYCVKISDEYLGEYVATHEFAHTLINLKVDSYKNYVGIDVEYFQNARGEIESVYERYMADIAALSAREKSIKGRFFTAANQADAVKIQEEFSQVKRELAEKIISKYSLTNADEFMAEAFTDVMIGDKPTIYSKEVVDILNRYFGR